MGTSSGNSLDAGSVLPSGYRVDEVRTIGRRQFIRACPVELGVSGSRSFLRSGAGLYVSAAHVHHGVPGAESFTGDSDVMKIHVRLSGRSRVGYEHRADRVVTEMSFGALIHPCGEAKFEHFDAAAKERSITVACTAEFLSGDFGIEARSLPADLMRFLQGGGCQISGLDVPLQLETRLAAETIFDELATDPSGALMIESRALELLARFFDQARSLHGDSDARVLNMRDRQIAERARAALEDQFVDPPNIKALARDVGTHAAKLMRVFKAVHGCTMSDWLEGLRMERARWLLAKDDMPVTQIAYELGYAHPSNFATAFRRRFGVPPSQARDSCRRAPSDSRKSETPTEQS